MCNATQNHASLTSPRPTDDKSIVKHFLESHIHNKKTRRKLWEIPSRLHCPVIGTCLEVQELDKIAKKVGAQPKGDLTEYDIHVSFVSSAGERNTLSLATHKALDKKYATMIRRAEKIKALEQLDAFWSQAVARGEVPSALWAIVTHPKCDKNLRMRMFEDVHMLSHQIGAGQRADLQRLNEAEAELAQLKHEMDQLQKKSRQQITQRDKRITTLESDLEQSKEAHRQTIQTQQMLEQQCRKLTARLHQVSINENEKQLAETNRRLQQTEIAYQRIQSSYAKAEQTISALKHDHQEIQAECQVLEKFVARDTAPNCAACTEAECSQCPDLQGQRILCVGGHKRLIGHYRTLVSACNGAFTHHDGGMEDNRQRLESMLSSADAVICAADFVSHDAYYRLKRFCKRNQKPHALLRSSGISTFARALDRMAD